MNSEEPAALTIRAHAKINLTLDVFSKRADGFHSIATVLQAVSLHDTLTLTRRDEPGVVLTCDSQDANVPTDASNLAFRAAQMALEAVRQESQESPDAAKNDFGIAIHLEKRVPSQAGLGGGSSDAAAALVGVNALLNLQLNDETLHEIASSLGSDVPFFLTGGAAAARGRGENLTALPDIEPFWLVIVKPDVGVSTGWAYEQLDAVPDRASHRATKRYEEALREGDQERILAWQSNDFELPVFQHFPPLAWLHDELLMSGAASAHLCGSGSALYGVMSGEAAARRTAALLQSKYPQTFVARTLSRAETTFSMP